MKIKAIIVLCIIIPMLTSVAMAQKKYALLVGISNYHVLDKNNEWNDIHGVNDVKLISCELKKQNFQITALLDAQATKDRIVLELRKLSKKVSKGSIVYIHFSMHGQLFDDELSIIKGDELWDESLVPVDALIAYDGNYKGKNHLVDDELNKYTESIRNKVGKSGIVYVAVDACHAGEASKGGLKDGVPRGTKRLFTNNKGKRFKSVDSRSSYFTISTKPGQSPIIYLEACKGRQINTEMRFGEKYFGPMSYFICQIIRRKRVNTDVSWVYDVKSLMDKKGPQIQNMVIEKSK